MPQRQEVLNVVLADLLNQRGVVAGAENIFYEDRVRHMPDVIVQFQGLRLAIEGEFAATDARTKALNSAIRRVESGIAHMGLGVVYPGHLREVEQRDLRQAMSLAPLDIVVISEAGNSGFNTGNIENLEQLLRRTLEQLIRGDVVAEAVALIDAAVDKFAGNVVKHSGISGRVAIKLGWASSEEEAGKLKPKQRAASCRIGGLVLLNAMIFQEVLAGSYVELASLRVIRDRNNAIELPRIWKYILEEINFYSVFHLSSEIFDCLTADASVTDTLNEMMGVALKIVSRRAALNHDLMGRVFHRLLADAKYLGTYYTKVSAATMLLKLALRPENWSRRWESLEDVSKLKVADLACGTGTLLVVAADAILDNHISASAATGRQVELDQIHQSLTERILYGYDVLASAIHLTASNLALRSPRVPFNKMNLYVMPYGGKGNLLGTLEFFDDKMAQLSMDMAGEIEQVSGQGSEALATEIPELDLCVMNPPFVRSVGGNLLFGSMPEPQRPKMRKRLRKLVPVSDASTNSGLSPSFVALSERYIRKEGRLALVLPIALLNGDSWKRTRNLIRTWFQIDFLLVSHDAENWSFSESSKLGDVLLIATRTHRAPTNHRVKVINLWHNPTTAIEALFLVSQIQNRSAPDLISDQGATNLELGGSVSAEMVEVDWDVLKLDWFLPCAFAQADLARVVINLRRGEVWLPTRCAKSQIDLCRLGDLGVLGRDRRNIYDGFKDVAKKTPFPAFWGHDTEAVNKMSQISNCWLQPLSKPRKGGRIQDASKLWQSAGTVLLPEGARLNTCKAGAIRTETKVLSNVW